MRHPALFTVNGIQTLHAKDRLSSDRAIRELGVSFRPLDETLRDTVAWFRTNGYLGEARGMATLHQAASGS
jgi:nucleoside-diphosphate-sugar epimerase